MAYVRSAKDLARLAANAQALLSAGVAPALGQGYQGHFVVPGDALYEVDRQVADVAVQRYPKLIAYCACENDVRIVLHIAAASLIPLVCRAGGHSTAGYSVNDGIVLDVSGLNQVRVDAPGRTALVQAGASFGIINNTLNAYRLHLPGGGCEGVCVGGYMQGGGYGFTSREYGMHIDTVLSFRMMLADGSVVAASRTENTALFWAVRGGTGNNFGVLLDVTYRLSDLFLAWGFGLQWQIDEAPAALLEMQTNYMLTGASPKLGYMTVITTDPQGHQVLLMRGMYHGSAKEGKAAIASLLATPGASMAIDRVDSYASLNTALLETPYPIPPLPAGVKEDKQAGYIATMLTLADWQRIIAYYKTTPLPYNTAVIEPYGGAINQIPPDDCAFVHRSVQMDFFVDVFWIDDSQKPVALAWLDGFMALMQPFFNGMVYQNYPRATFTDYPLRYWGLETYHQLCLIKAKYDPTGFFTFPQAIGVWQDTTGGVGHPGLTAEITREV